jgi:hypothetical protein
VATNDDERERREGGDPDTLDVFLPVLARVVRVVERIGIPHAFMGGMASTIHGRDRLTHDIDILVRPGDDALALLHALAADGFETERRDEAWLYKANLGEVLVDIIFEAGADIARVSLDDEMIAHTRMATLGDVEFRVLAPDWDYLVKRARVAPERVASLLLYARGERLTVPDEVLTALLPAGAAEADPPPAESSTYELRRVHDALAGDPRTAELEVDVALTDGELVLTGVVATDARREALTEVARDVVPDRPVRNLATVEPPSAEPHVEHLP